MSWWSALFPCPCGGGERPGGLSLTERAAALCGFAPGDRLLDLACGDGTTLRYLRETLHCDAVGLDSDPARRGVGVLLGEAERLPFPDCTFRGVFLECALSQMGDPDRVLAECARVLGPGGKLVLSDLYARSGTDAPDTPLGRLDSRETLTERLRAQGLEPLRFEDHSPELTSLWVSALMSGAGGGLSETLHACPDLRRAKCGYYLCVAERGAG